VGKKKPAYGWGRAGERGEREGSNASIYKTLEPQETKRLSKGTTGPTWGGLQRGDLDVYLDPCLEHTQEEKEVTTHAARMPERGGHHRRNRESRAPGGANSGGRRMLRVDKGKPVLYRGKRGEKTATPRRYVQVVDRRKGTENRMPISWRGRYPYGDLAPGDLETVSKKEGRRKY